MVRAKVEQVADSDERRSDEQQDAVSERGARTEAQARTELSEWCLYVRARRNIKRETSKSEIQRQAEPVAWRRRWDEIAGSGGMILYARRARSGS